MMMVVMVGLLAVTADGGIDVIYCTYFGLMAFVSGMMDAAIVIEKAVWASDWVPFSAHDPLKKHMKPVVLLLSHLCRLHLQCCAIISIRIQRTWRPRACSR